MFRRTEGLLEVYQAGHLWRHIVQMSLQRSAHQQRVGQVRDVDANDGEGISAAQHTELSAFRQSEEQKPPHSVHNVN